MQGVPQGAPFMFMGLENRRAWSEFRHASLPPLVDPLPAGRALYEAFTGGPGCATPRRAAGSGRRGKVPCRPRGGRRDGLVELAAEQAVERDAQDVRDRVDSLRRGRHDAALDLGHQAGGAPGTASDLTHRQAALGSQAAHDLFPDGAALGRLVKVNHVWLRVIAVLADRRVIAVAPVAELETLDHPWVQEYFNGPRGRAARDVMEGNA